MHQKQDPAAGQHGDGQTGKRLETVSCGQPWSVTRGEATAVGEGALFTLIFHC